MADAAEVTQTEVAVPEQEVPVVTESPDEVVKSGADEPVEPETVTSEAVEADGEPDESAEKVQEEEPAKENGENGENGVTTENGSSVELKRKSLVDGGGDVDEVAEKKARTAEEAEETTAEGDAGLNGIEAN